MLTRLVFALVLLPTWGASGQDRPAFSLQSMKVRETGQSADFSATWRGYGQMAQVFYVQGFIEGEINGNNDATTALEAKGLVGVAEWRDTTLESAGIMVGTVVKVMSDLYEDPANAYIPFAQMFYIARAKLKGQSIEESLTASRARALSVSPRSRR